MEILIKNGTLVNAGETKRSDILISDSKISETGVFVGPRSAGTEIIDAAGRYIIPGGIDPHVHLHLPTQAGFSADDFFTGSRAGLFGGTTSFLDFVTQGKGQSLPDALHQRKQEAANSLTDYSFHVSPVEWRNTIPDEIKTCLDEGITSFKVYMAYLDTIGLREDGLFRVMKAVGQTGGMITIHCETGEEIEILRKKFIKEGKTSPFWHPLSRSPQMEAEAVKKAIHLADKAGCPLYIVHVSAALSLQNIRKAKQQGQPVFAETCPQYLLLDDKKYTGDFMSTAPYVMSPPLRKKDDNIALWEAVADGTIDTIGTDHCPFTLEQKKAGIDDFTKIPNGAGGIEHRLSLIYHFGVLQNRISINRFTELVSTNSAKIFGLYPRKGIIRPGADADLVIWNPDQEQTISSKTHHQNCDINIYEGMKVKGGADYVIVKGKIAIKDGEWQNVDLKGDFLYRRL